MLSIIPVPSIFDSQVVFEDADGREIRTNVGTYPDEVFVATVRVLREERITEDGVGGLSVDVSELVEPSVGGEVSKEVALLETGAESRTTVVIDEVNINGTRKRNLTNKNCLKTNGFRVGQKMLVLYEEKANRQLWKTNKVSKKNLEQYLFVFFGRCSRKSKKYFSENISRG